MRQTIFIHIPRTAGTSINEVAEKLVPFQDLSYKLRPKCDPSVTWTSVEHIGVQSLIDREVFSQEWYDNCFKFAFVRNPWDRLLSLYYHLKGYRTKQKRQRESNAFLTDFATFVEALVSREFVRPLSRLNVDDWSQANSQLTWLSCGVNFIGKYETLDSDWERVCFMIGMKHIRLHKTKQTTRAGGRSVHYDAKTKKLVGDYYGEEIERFGYKF